MEDMKIYSATIEDHDFILQVNEENVEVLSPMDEKRLMKFEEMAPLLWVVYVGGTRAAFLIALDEQATSYDSENYRWFKAHYERFLYIDRIVIDEPFRQSGLGTWLYREVFNYAKAQGIPYVTAEIDTIPYNAVSLNFHKKMGFKEVGEQFVRDGSVKVSLQEAAVI